MAGPSGSNRWRDEGAPAPPGVAAAPVPSVKTNLGSIADRPHECDPCKGRKPDPRGPARDHNAAINLARYHEPHPGDSALARQGHGQNIRGVVVVQGRSRQYHLLRPPGTYRIEERSCGNTLK
jgi:hypothetical protein